MVVQRRLLTRLEKIVTMTALTSRVRGGGGTGRFAAGSPLPPVPPIPSTSIMGIVLFPSVLIVVLLYIRYSSTVLLHSTLNNNKGGVGGNRTRGKMPCQ